MECFTHSGTQAVGFCKYCGKGVCRQCAHDTDVGLVCSQAHEEEVRLSDTLTKHAAKVYAIGDNASNSLPTQVWGSLLFALGFLGFGVYDFFTARTPLSGFFAFFGLVFLLGAFIAWWKFRQHRINV